MKQCSLITVYNNEGQHFGTDHRYIASFDLTKEQISYGCTGMSFPASSVIVTEDFDDIIVCLYEMLNNTLSKKANNSHCFSDELRYRNWLRQVDFSDRDVSWAVMCKMRDGRHELYISISSDPAPVELDELEKMLKDLLNIEEGVACYED